METVTAAVKLERSDYEALSEASKTRAISVEELLAQLAADFARRSRAHKTADQKKKALNVILGLRLPVSDWEKMEQEIEEAHSPCGIKDTIR